MVSGVPIPSDKGERSRPIPPYNSYNPAYTWLAHRRPSPPGLILLHSRVDPLNGQRTMNRISALSLQFGALRYLYNLEHTRTHTYVLSHTSGSPARAGIRTIIRSRGWLREAGRRPLERRALADSAAQCDVRT